MIQKYYFPRVTSVFAFTSASTQKLVGPSLTIEHFRLETELPPQKWQGTKLMRDMTSSQSIANNAPFAYCFANVTTVASPPAPIMGPLPH